MSFIADILICCVSTHCKWAYNAFMPDIFYIRIILPWKKPAFLDEFIRHVELVQRSVKKQIYFIWIFKSPCYATSFNSPGPIIVLVKIICLGFIDIFLFEQRIWHSQVVWVPIDPMVKRRNKIDYKITNLGLNLP